MYVFAYMYHVCMCMRICMYVGVDVDVCVCVCVCVCMCMCMCKCADVMSVHSLVNLHHPILAEGFINVPVVFINVIYDVLIRVLYVMETHSKPQARRGYWFAMAVLSDCC